MNFSKFIGAGVALASSTLVLGSTLSAPAQAASFPSDFLNKQLVFIGQGTVANNGNLTFTTASVDAGNSASVFSGYTSPVTISGNSFSFSGVSLPNLTFALPGTPKVNTISGTPVAVSNVLNGFINSSLKATGVVVTYPNSGAVTYSASFQTVPEPFTILGTATALGFGAFMKSKKKKEDQVSA